MNWLRISALLVMTCFVLAAGVTPAEADVVYGTGVSGRFVKVTNLNPYYRSLAIGEMEAFGFGVAPNNSSGLSSNDIAATFEADGAASGYVLNHGSTPAPVNNAFESGAPTYNASGVGAYYIADLGSTQNLGTVRLWQRLDCCYERLEDLSVSVLADNAGVPGATVFTAEYGRVPNNPSFGSIDVYATRLIRPGGSGAVGTETQGSAGGRFIRVQNNGTASRSLAIGEIEAFLAGVTPGASYDNANDVALSTKGATWQSETGALQHGFAGHTIDGLATGGAESYHRLGVGIELVIDLGQTRDVGTIRVWQRGDSCCQDRLQNFSVSLLDDDGAGNPGAVLDTQSYAGQPPTNSYASFTLPAFTNTKFTIEGIDTLQIELNAGAATGDLLRIGSAGTGALTIKPGATLSVTNLGGIFSSLQSFNILDFGTLSGSFSAVSLPALTMPATFWDTSALYTTGQISVGVPEPAAWLLLALGALAFYPPLRRR